MFCCSTTPVEGSTSGVERRDSNRELHQEWRFLLGDPKETPQKPHPKRNPPRKTTPRKESFYPGVAKSVSVPANGFSSRCSLERVVLWNCSAFSHTKFTNLCLLCGGALDCLPGCGPRMQSKGTNQHDKQQEQWWQPHRSLDRPRSYLTNDRERVMAPATYKHRHPTATEHASRSIVDDGLRARGHVSVLSRASISPGRLRTPLRAASRQVSRHVPPSRSVSAYPGPHGARTLRWQRNQALWPKYLGTSQFEVRAPLPDSEESASGTLPVSIHCARKPWPKTLPRTSSSRRRCSCSNIAHCYDTLGAPRMIV